MQQVSPFPQARIHAQRSIPWWATLFLFMLLLVVAIGFFVLVLADPTLAAEPGEKPAPTLLLPTDQLWTLVAGALVPLGGYVLNYMGPIVNEKTKAVVQVVLAAIAGGIVQAITVGDVGFNDVTLQYVLSAVITALFAHGLLYKPSGINTALGGGRNVQDNPRR